LAKLEGCFMCNDSMFTEEGSGNPQVIARLDVSTAMLNRDW